MRAFAQFINLAFLYISLLLVMFSWKLNFASSNISLPELLPTYNFIEYKAFLVNSKTGDKADNYTLNKTILKSSFKDQKKLIVSFTKPEENIVLTLTNLIQTSNRPLNDIGQRIKIIGFTKSGSRVFPTFLSHDMDGISDAGRGICEISGNRSEKLFTVFNEAIISVSAETECFKCGPEKESIVSAFKLINIEKISMNTNEFKPLLEQDFCEIDTINLIIDGSVSMQQADKKNILANNIKTIHDISLNSNLKLFIYLLKDGDLNLTRLSTQNNEIFKSEIGRIQLDDFLEFTFSVPGKFTCWNGLTNLSRNKNVLNLLYTDGIPNRNFIVDINPNSNPLQSLNDGSGINVVLINKNKDEIQSIFFEKVSYNEAIQNLIYKKCNDENKSNERTLQLDIYPNPSSHSGILITGTIDNEVYNGKYTIQLIDGLGKVYYSKKEAFEFSINSLIETNTLKKGIYYLLIDKDGEILFQEKIVIQ